MSSNNQNQAMQRFFEFVFNVPGDCFCCTWSISCFLETVEHMEGDRRWRSICTIGMSFLSLIIVFLLTLALCPKFYWSEINQIVMFNGTRTITHINYSSSTYQPTMYLNSTELNESFISATNSLLQSPINDISMDDISMDDISMDDIYRNKPYNLTVHHVTYQHIGLHLNLWHINYCTQNYTNDTYWKTYINQTNLHKNIKDPIFINNTAITTNESCSFITYRESGTPSSTQDLSLWFIIFVIVLLLLGCICVLGTHPIFDKCHRKNTTLRSSIQKILAIAITILCACILNWSSFVFAAVFESQVESYSEWREKEPITQSNLGTGMLAVNGAMLLGIILSVIHCGAPIRTELNINNHNNNNNDNNNNNNNNNNENNDDNQDEEKTVDQDDEKTTSVHLTNQQRILLRHIPGGNSSMGNMAILTNPDNWFKSNNNNNNNSNNNNNDNEILSNKKDNVIDINDDEFKEFEYQNMNINENINKKEDDDRIYNANLSMKRIRKKDKTLIINEKKQSLLLCDDSDNDNDNYNDNDDNKKIVTKLTQINSNNNSDNEID